jgi:hypothetical protein
VIFKKFKTFVISRNVKQTLVEEGWEGEAGMEPGGEVFVPASESIPALSTWSLKWSARVGRRKEGREKGGGRREGGTKDMRGFFPFPDSDSDFCSSNNFLSSASFRAFHF